MIKQKKVLTGVAVALFVAAPIALPVQAQETAETTGTANGVPAAPGTTPIQEGPATVGSQGTAGGTQTGTSAVAEGQSAVPLIQVPDLADAGLADARLRESAASPELTLEETVALALQNNPTPKQARASLEAALARAGIAASQGKPQANVGGGVDYQETVRSSGGAVGSAGDGFSSSLSLNVTLPIYSGGRVRNSRRSAQASARAALATAQQVEQEIAAQTILAYLSALQNSELLDVADSNLATARESRRVSGVRFDAGVAARLEVLQSDARLAAALQSRIEAANRLAQSRAAINILMARAPETPLRLQRITALSLPAIAQFPLAEQATAIAGGATPPPSAELRADANGELRSLEASRQQIEAAEFNVEAQKAQRKPSLGATLTSLLRNPLKSLGNIVLGAGISVAQSLFDGGRISSQVREARASLEQARLSLDGQQLQVANAIEGSLLTLDSATKRLASADTAVLAAQEAVRAAQLGFTAGVGTPLDVLNAQNALVSAQTDAVNARFEVAQAQVQLAAATALTQSGSATGRSGLGSSAGTGQNSSFSASGSNQNSGANAGRTTGSPIQIGTGGTGTGTSFGQ